MSGGVYDPVANPYAPGAGTPPPALVGRDAELEIARVALARLLAQRPTQHLLVQGLRGVGKTVLLRAISSMAEHAGYHVLRVEGDPSVEALGPLVRQCRRLLDDAQPTARIRRAVQILKSISIPLGPATVTLQAGERSGRDQGFLVSEVFPELLESVAAAFAEGGGGLAVIVDEAQAMPISELAAVLAGVHAATQQQLPVWAALAGLPNLLGRAAKAKTYAERMFSVADLGPLGQAEAMAAVTEPAAELQVSWAAPAIQSVVASSAGYPYFLQVWAYHTWNVARDEPISRRDVTRATATVRRALDDGFFAARVARVPESERRYLRALASLGPGPHPSRAVAEALGTTTPSVGALRDRLIADGVVFSPQYGQVALALPMLDEYLRRAGPG